MLTKDEVVQALFELSDSDRDDVRRLLNEQSAREVESSEETDTEWTAELDRRLAAYESGETTTTPWEVVMARLESRAFARRSGEGSAS